jgi:predicted GIY-YIG superfamily endonuclease
MDRQSWVYILQCADGSYYTGCTSDIEGRLAGHASGKFGGYTATRLPVRLLFSQQFSAIEDAINAERQIKGWSRKKKEALIAGDFAQLRELSKCRNETAADAGKSR